MEKINRTEIAQLEKHSNIWESWTCSRICTLEDENCVEQREGEREKLPYWWNEWRDGRGQSI